MPIRMIPVKSSHIVSVGYDEETGQLHVNFIQGAHYIYDHVPKSVYEGLKAARSVGKFFSQNIKGVYEGVRQ